MLRQYKRLKSNKTNHCNLILIITSFIDFLPQILVHNFVISTIVLTFQPVHTASSKQVFKMNTSLWLPASIFFFFFEIRTRSLIGLFCKKREIVRMKDVITLSSEKFVVDGIEITEKLRFFKGNILLTTNERNLLFTRFMKNVR